MSQRKEQPCILVTLSQSPTPQPAPAACHYRDLVLEKTEPDYIYDPDDWEITFNYEDKGELLYYVHGAQFIPVGEVKRFATLISGPERFAAHVPVTWDDKGDPDDAEFQWFETEKEARTAAAAKPNDRAKNEIPATGDLSNG